MNFPGLVKKASSLVALAICAACSGGSAGAPSTAPLNYQYIGKTLWVNGRPVHGREPEPNAPLRDDSS